MNKEAMFELFAAGFEAGLEKSSTEYSEWELFAWDKDIPDEADLDKMIEAEKRKFIIEKFNERLEKLEKPGFWTKKVFLDLDPKRAIDYFKADRREVR